MPTEVVLPKWGLTMSEAIVTRWFKEPGDAIEEEETLLEVETEKANAEIPAPITGVLAEILVKEGETVAVGTVLALIREKGEETPSASVSEEEDVSVPSSATTGDDGGRADPPLVLGTAPGAAHPTDAGRSVHRASPVARRIAANLGVDLSRVEGTGNRGLITEADVRAAAEPSLSQVVVEDGVRVEPLSRMRKAVASAMGVSLREIPQLTLTRAATVTGALSAKVDAGTDVSFTDIVVWAAAQTLVKHQRLNGHLIDDALHLYSRVHIGLAVALDGGLVTPVIRNADAQALTQLAVERRRVASLARAGRLQVEDLSGATFTITNLGGYGIDAFTPIINPPEVGILGVGRIRAVGPAHYRETALAHECVLSLTFDHRALDGAPAALFLADLCSLLEDGDSLPRA